MPPRRLSSPSERPPRGAWCLLLLAGACSTSSAPTFPTTDRWEPARRQPDGVAIDPLPASPAVARRADTSALGAVALSPPAPVSEALATLRAFLDAIVVEDTVAVLRLFTERGAWVQLPGRGSVPIGSHLRERVRRLNYPQLAGVTVFREADAEVYAHDDLEPPLPGRPARPAGMEPSDLLIKIRVITPRIGAERFFGDEVTFLLRPDRGRFRIHSMFEEFQLP